jgi:hypothetical protein
LVLLSLADLGLVLQELELQQVGADPVVRADPPAVAVEILAHACR